MSNDLAANSSCPSGGCGAHGSCIGVICLCEEGFHGLTGWNDRGDCDVSILLGTVIHWLSMVLAALLCLFTLIAHARELQDDGCCCGPSKGKQASHDENNDRKESAVSTSNDMDTNTNSGGMTTNSADSLKQYTPETHARRLSWQLRPPSRATPSSPVSASRTASPKKHKPTKKRTLSRNQKQARTRRFVMHGHALGFGVLMCCYSAFREGWWPSLSGKCSTREGCSLELDPVPWILVRTMIIGLTMSVSGILVPSMWLCLLPSTLLNRYPLLVQTRKTWVACAVPATFIVDGVFFIFGILPIIDEGLFQVSIKGPLVMIIVLSVLASSMINLVAVKIFALATDNPPTLFLGTLLALFSRARFKVLRDPMKRVVKKLRVSVVVLNGVAGGAIIGCILMLAPTYFRERSDISETAILVRMYVACDLHDVMTCYVSRVFLHKTAPIVSGSWNAIS